MARRLTKWMVEDMVRTLATDPDTCILLSSAVTPGKGPARVIRDGKRWSLHRYLYYRVEGVEPDPTYALLPGGCATDGCLNPFHRVPSKWRAGSKRTRCPNGHKYTPSNTIKGGRYRCRKCTVDRNARRRKQEYPQGWCHHGHRMSGSNVYRYTRADGTTGRKCRTCQLDRQRAYRERNKQ